MACSFGYFDPLDLPALVEILWPPVAGCRGTREILKRTSSFRPHGGSVSTEGECSGVGALRCRTLDGTVLARGSAPSRTDAAGSVNRCSATEYRGLPTSHSQPAAACGLRHLPSDSCCYVAAFRTGPVTAFGSVEPLRLALHFPDFFSGGRGIVFVFVSGTLPTSQLLVISASAGKSSIAAANLCLPLRARPKVRFKPQSPGACAELFGDTMPAVLSGTKQALQPVPLSRPSIAEVLREVAALGLGTGRYLCDKPGDPPSAPGIPGT